MKHTRTLIAAAAALLLAHGALAQVATAGGVLVGLDQRRATLARGRNLVSPPPDDFPLRLAAAKDPFNLPVAVVAVRSSDPLEGVPAARAVEILSEELKPTGAMIRGDRRFLILDGRLVRVGDPIPVTYRGRTYQLTLLDVDTRSYEVGYRDARMTRLMSGSN